MNRKRLSIILTFFLLVQSISSLQALSAETWSLNPPTKVSLNESQVLFKKLCDILCIGLFIYKMDVKRGLPKEELMNEYGSFISGFKEVRFDLERIDTGRKGWTRYYPFSVDGKDFIIRIFLTQERVYQPKIPVLFEGITRNQELTFQILPGINDILSDMKIAPHIFYPPSRIAKSSV